MDGSADSIAEQTLFALETRLRRIEFVLAGSSEDPVGDLYARRKSGKESSVKSRLNTLERDLSRLAIKSRTVKDMLDLHTNFPEIFKNVYPATQTSSLSSEEKLSTVLSAAPSFHATSSQLTSIMDTLIPNPSVSADLISLVPRINRAEVVQQAQAKEIADLRRRSAALLERWYLLGIEGVNECFAEWDERALEVDKILSRKIRLAKDS
ncbi:hypothetical protein Q9L58_003603 [Maublancomyces gigas]|uniref:Nuclear distribution protein RO10 n=1 Tax=Discina gigas TaxID=1032678 RepID=A0ABR3GN95_9PEZI